MATAATVTPAPAFSPPLPAHLPWPTGRTPAPVVRQRPARPDGLSMVGGAPHPAGPAIPPTATGRRRHTRFRPCIDLHGGLVKQIVGGTLTDAPSSTDDASDTAGADAGSGGLRTNFSTTTPAADFAARYAADGLPGGHVIMLGDGNQAAARSALGAYPGGLHVGGGINPSNAGEWLDAGASHVIVTSYVFRGGSIDWARVDEMRRAVGRERLVLDVSCRKRPVAAAAAGGCRNDDGGGGEGGDVGDDRVEYVVCTDRWTRTTDYVLSAAGVRRLATHCDELLVHAVDEEGKRGGIDTGLVTRLAGWASGAAADGSDLPVVYAGGARCLADLDTVDRLSRGRVDLTIGSALDLFGGDLPYADAVAWMRRVGG